MHLLAIGKNPRINRTQQAASVFTNTEHEEATGFFSKRFSGRTQTKPIEQ
jgi:hypothetical protein